MVRPSRYNVFDFWMVFTISVKISNIFFCFSVFFFFFIEPKFLVFQFDWLLEFNMSRSKRSFALWNKQISIFRLNVTIELSISMCDWAASPVCTDFNFLTTNERKKRQKPGNKWNNGTFCERNRDDNQQFSSNGLNPKTKNKTRFHL